MEIVEFKGEKFYKIENYNQMRTFFMSMVSDSNHWLFISSNGGLTAGRKNSEFSLFPYYTEDKITEMYDTTGSKTILKIQTNTEITIWEPFSDRFNEKYSIQRNLYKSIYGNSIIFEEINNTFNLAFRYQWSTSNIFGFIKSSEIENKSDSEKNITVLDGIQNILPHGVSSELQNSTSNLVDAYKRNEIDSSSGLAMFALSAIIVDKAEPSESLKCNIAWSIGLNNPTYLLSSRQLNNFRYGSNIVAEEDLKGEKGAYFIVEKKLLPANEKSNWQIICNVNQIQNQVIDLIHSIKTEKKLAEIVFDDIKKGSSELVRLNASADGIQYTADDRKNNRHFANSLFNIMRGGVFNLNYQIEKTDFLTFISKANKQIYESEAKFLNKLPPIFDRNFLINACEKENILDLIRLSTEYLPLKFSRRHGDPSRPWNKFSINTQNENDGSKILDYEGNWRDIFQNWEALALSYPDFIDGMIFKFLNATTFDGYNPYRVTKDGFDWETIEPDDPWSYIGYWGDHQIIYLLKFLEFIEKVKPGKLNSYFDKEYFVYAAVPYRIKSYSKITENAKDTIDFDHAWAEKINIKREKIGADGALIYTGSNKIFRVNLIEKLLATSLAKLSNFIPDAGIWMNTQRPEWNDANNALVGNGVSMVTLSYLRRFFKFFENLLANTNLEIIKLSSEMVEFYHTIRENLLKHETLLNHPISDSDRKMLVDCLGKAGSDYRNQIYDFSFWGKKRTHSISGLKNFVRVVLAFIDKSIETNKRPDNLYHAYNLMSYSEKGIQIDNLNEMLEGQVAILSSGLLSATESLALLDALRESKLYREDQRSYLLYPNKNLPKFLEKNSIPYSEIENNELLIKLINKGNHLIGDLDRYNHFHFNGNFNNINQLIEKLNELKTISEYTSLVKQNEQKTLDLFEKTFNHKAFTGRSGTFFAYEGLGSIYWHMVSKLHLAVYEVLEKAYQNKEKQEIIEKLRTHFYAIGEGIGCHKTPQEYGAFPTDPYSHTPAHKGVQQPGMTGQVKEDVLIRFSELGVRINSGKLKFEPLFLPLSEFYSTEKEIDFISVNGLKSKIKLPKNSLAFSICQVPITYIRSKKNEIHIQYENKTEHIDGIELNEEQTKKIFSRSGEIQNISVYLN
jgi:hypothetical protein